MILLFDESGTPSIVTDPRTDFFIGVGVVYDSSHEQVIFSRCKIELGLEKPKPLKNDRIGKTRAVRIAQVLSELPLSIYVSTVNIADPEYQATLGAYEVFGNRARENYRGVGRRPIAQIIHTYVVDHCLYHAITGHFEAGGNDAVLSPFIDDWSIPQCDVGIYLEQRSASLQKQIASLRDWYDGRHPIRVAPIRLLSADDNRKRFIDVTTSVFSRAYLKTSNPKYDVEPALILKQSGKALFTDATGFSIGTMQRMMGEFMENGERRRQ